MTLALPLWAANLVDDDSFTPLLVPDGSDVHRFDDRAPEPGDGFLLGSGTVGGHRVLVAAQDSNIAAGTLGPWHFAALVALFRHAVRQGLPVMLCFDTAGVRVQEAAQGMRGFREALHALYDLKIHGKGGVAVVGGRIGCFGAGAELAVCLGKILMTDHARLAIAGPKALEVAVGKDKFNAADPAAVASIMGVLNRCRTGEAWSELPANHADARARIAEAFMSEAAPAAPPAVDESAVEQKFVLPNGQNISLRDGVLHGHITVVDTRLEVVGIVSMAPLDIARTRRITGLLDPESTIPLLLWTDANQAFGVSQDRDGLALAYAGLAERIAQCRANGRQVIAYGTRGGSGAAFMVLGMMAGAVGFSATAVCHAVPPAIATALLRDKAIAAQAPAAELMNIGAIDLIGDGEFDDTISSLLSLPKVRAPQPGSWESLIDRYLSRLGQGGGSDERIMP